MTSVSGSRKGMIKPMIVLAFGVLFTAAVSYVLTLLVASQDRARFATEMAETEAALTRKVDLHIALLRAGAGLASAVGNVSKEQFHTFVERLQLPVNYPGVLGIGLTERVPADGLAAFVARRRAEGDPDFHAWPPTSRAEHNPIAYIEPLDERNRVALGFDMTSEPRRRAAMERARDTGMPAMSAKVELVRGPGEANQLPGLLVYMPVFAGAAEPTTPQEARGALRGYVYSPLIVSDFLRDVRPMSEKQLTRFALYDSSVEPGNLLYDSSPDAGKAWDGRMLAQTRMEVAGREWIIRHESLPAFEAGSSRALVPALLFLGLLTSGFGSLVFWREVQARLEAQTETERRRAAEREQQVLTQELHHRVKNMLSIVSAIGNQTARNAASMPDFRQAFAARISAFALTHDLLLQSNWKGSQVEALLRAELGAYDGGESRIRLSGPETALTDRQTVSFGMAIHELATNAAKYGALAAPDGTVEVAWSVETRDACPWLTALWTERGGPSAAPSERSGFGSKLIDQMLGGDLGGRVERRFGPDGLQVTMEFPLAGS